MPFYVDDNKKGTLTMILRHLALQLFDPLILDPRLNLNLSNPPIRILPSEEPQPIHMPIRRQLCQPRNPRSELLDQRLLALCALRRRFPELFQ